MEDKQVYVPKGSMIKVYFKNGTTLEGIVVIWNDKKGILQSPQNNSRLLIYNPVENVMMLRLFPEEIAEPIELDIPEIEETETVIIQQNPCPIQEEDQIKPELSSNERSINDRTKRLVEHRLLQTSQIRQKLAQKLKNSLNLDNANNIVQTPPKVETTYYASPNFSKPRLVVSPRKEKK